MTDYLRQFTKKAHKQIAVSGISLAFKHHAPNLSDADARRAAEDAVLYGTGVVFLGDDGTARHVPYHEYMRRKK